MSGLNKFLKVFQVLSSRGAMTRRYGFQLVVGILHLARHDCKSLWQFASSCISKYPEVLPSH